MRLGSTAGSLDRASTAGPGVGHQSGPWGTSGAFCRRRRRPHSCACQSRTDRTPGRHSRCRPAQDGVQFAAIRPHVAQQMPCAVPLMTVGSLAAGLASAGQYNMPFTPLKVSHDRSGADFVGPAELLHAGSAASIDPQSATSGVSAGRGEGREGGIGRGGGVAQHPSWIFARRRLWLPTPPWL